MWLRDLGITAIVSMEDYHPPEYCITLRKAGKPPVAQCWIPSESDWEFGVLVCLPPAPRLQDLVFALYLDGRKVILEGGYISKWYRPCQWRDSDSFMLSTELVSKRHSRPFKFVDTETKESVPGGVKSKRSVKNKHLVQIRLEIYGCNNMKSELQPRLRGDSLRKWTPTRVEAADALAHCIGPGESFETRGFTGVRMVPLDHELLGTFVFNYRDINTLLLKGKISKDLLPLPRAQPPPSPATRKRQADWDDRPYIPLVQDFRVQDGRLYSQLEEGEKYIDISEDVAVSRRKGMKQLLPPVKRVKYTPRSRSSSLSALDFEAAKLPEA